MTISVLIVAGGSGSRMGGDLPKQFMDLDGVPVLVRTIRRFEEVLPRASLYLALPVEYHPLWLGMAEEYGLAGRCTLCEGGATRFDTVKNALAVMAPSDIILVHDAVRPLVSAAVINAAVEGALASGACIPVVEPVDSFRTLLQGGGSAIADRTHLRAVQTPQGFRYGILKAAYDRPFDDSFTDDASVVESSGHPVSLCAGSPLNIKITWPHDMALARAILSLPAENN